MLQEAGSAGSGQLRKQALLLFTVCHSFVSLFPHCLPCLSSLPHVSVVFPLFLFFPCLTLTALSPPLSSVYLIIFLIIHFSSCFHEAEMGGGPSQTINSLSSEWQRAASLSCGHHSLCHPSPQQAEHPAAQQGAVSHINLSHFTILTFLMSLPLSSITTARDHPQSPRFPSQGIFAALGRAQ